MCKTKFRNCGTVFPRCGIQFCNCGTGIRTCGIKTQSCGIRTQSWGEGFGGWHIGRRENDQCPMTNAPSRAKAGRGQELRGLPQSGGRRKLPARGVWSISNGSRTAYWGHEPKVWVRSPGFSRRRPPPAKAGTPNQRLPRKWLRRRVRGPGLQPVGRVPSSGKTAQCFRRGGIPGRDGGFMERSPWASRHWSLPGPPIPLKAARNLMPGRHRCPKEAGVRPGRGARQRRYFAS